MSFYDEDYVVLSVGAAEGTREGMRAAFEATVRRFRGRPDLVADEVRSDGTWALERGRFSIRLVDRVSGIEHVSHRRYLKFLVRRAEGRWSILRDLDNDVPPGE